MKTALRFIALAQAEPKTSWLKRHWYSLGVFWREGRIRSILDSGLNPLREMKFSEWWERDTFSDKVTSVKSQEIGIYVASQEGGLHLTPSWKIRATSALLAST